MSVYLASALRRESRRLLALAESAAAEDALPAVLSLIGSALQDLQEASDVTVAHMERVQR